MCSYRVESSKGVNQSHYRHSMNTERNYVFYVTQIEKTHIICRTHFVYVSYLYKSYPRMHDMPRVTIVFGKVVDLNQGNESYLYYRSLYSKKLSTLYQVTLQVYIGALNKRPLISLSWKRPLCIHIQLASVLKAWWPKKHPKVEGDLVLQKSEQAPA